MGNDDARSLDSQDTGGFAHPRGGQRAGGRKPLGCHAHFGCYRTDNVWLAGALPARRLGRFEGQTVIRPSAEVETLQSSAAPFCPRVYHPRTGRAPSRLIIRCPLNRRKVISMMSMRPPQHGSALPVLVRSGNLSLEIWSSDGCRLKYNATIETAFVLMPTALRALLVVAHPLDNAFAQAAAERIRALSVASISQHPMIARPSRAISPGSG